ncbi:MAG TPA: ZIP family metal transporter [Actinomycetota bacterium]|nr:ZIP family metal transporter [Actinomycetota bacterium]
MPTGEAWAASLVAVAIISAVSLFGAMVLLIRDNWMERALLFLISFAAGALLGDAFIHILPEMSREHGFGRSASLAILAGVLVFFVLEKILHWHHAHIPQEEVLHPVAITNLVGDGLHNFIDGAIVAASFLVSWKLGVATSVAVLLHEIPQELGDFGILIHAGLRPRRALALNFLTALTSVAGAVVVLAFSDLGSLEQHALPFTAGAFVYIAATDLIPELHKEPEIRRSLLQLLGLVVGIGVMLGLLNVG